MDDPTKLTEAQQNTAIKDPEHLKRWLAATGRRYLVLNTFDLVDGLPWPDGVAAFMQCIDAYRDHRRGMAITRTIVVNGVEREEPSQKDEFLEIEELDRAIRMLIGEASKRDPNWKLENPPL